MSLDYYAGSGPDCPGPISVMQCGRCGAHIYEGQKYYGGHVSPICMECLDEMEPVEILALCGEELNTAEREE